MKRMQDNKIEVIEINIRKCNEFSELLKLGFVG